MKVTTERCWMVVHRYEHSTITDEEIREALENDTERIRVFSIEGDRVSCEILDPYYFQRNIKYDGFLLWRQ